jgi:hypothetical protein
MCMELQDWKERLHENFANACCDNIDLENRVYEKFATHWEQWKKWKEDIHTDDVIDRAFDYLLEKDCEALHYARTEEDYLGFLD